MGIKRFYIDKDATITNAYKENLTTRATGSNMGASDILEVFTIYAQVNTASSEESKVLMNVPVGEITTARTNEDIPASGSVSFFLRLFNAEHAQTLPTNYHMQICAVTKSFDEGYGLDMNGYTDPGAPSDHGTNWEYASATDAWEETDDVPDHGFFSGSTNKYDFSASFGTEGTEDIEVDISSLIEDWISNLPELSGNYGIGVRVAPVSASLAKSFYTKKFHARNSEFFFKRPVVEARWNSSKKDDSANFYASSSLVPSADNLNTLYLYNYVRGQLKNIPAIDGGPIYVSVYSGSTPDNESPGDNIITLPADDQSAGGVAAAGDTNVTGGLHETGVYTASFAYTSSADTIFPVWHFNGTNYHTGSAITVNTYGAASHNPMPTHVTKITNLKSVYSQEESARFRLYIREKDWSPTIYTKATTDIENSIIEDAHFKIVRALDNHEIIGYDTGSNGTLLSYDASGSYFDLDMSLFEKDYAYEIKLSYKVNGKFREQKDTFKFRVE